MHLILQLSKKIKTLLVPYFAFAILSYLEWAIVEKWLLGTSKSVGYLKGFIGIFYSNNIDGFMRFNGVLWYITCLFVVESIFYYISKFAKTKYQILIYLVLLGIISRIGSFYLPLRLPWGIDIALIAIGFYGIGYISKNRIDYMYNIRVKKKIIMLLFGVIIGGIVSQINIPVLMYNNIYGNLIYFYLASFSGILSLMLLSMIINKSKILCYIGKNSLVILATHMKVILYVRTLMSILLNADIDGTWISALVLTLASIISSLPFIYIINKYLPFVVGKKKNKSSTVSLI